jgi:ribosomal protein S27AE
MADQRIKDPLYRCPHCGEQSVRVIDSRPLTAGTEPVVRRRRVCSACSHRWSTYEITDAAYASICETARLLKELFPYMPRKVLDVNCDVARPALHASAERT